MNEKIFLTLKCYHGIPSVLLPGDPTMELALVPSEESGTGSQTLFCSVWGFNPDIKWLSTSQQKHASKKAISIGEDGHMAVTSHITIPRQAWNQGETLTCEVSDHQKNISKSINKCTGMEVESQPLFSDFL